MEDKFVPDIALRPFLIRALYEWMESNGWTAHLIVDLTAKDVYAPIGFKSEDDSIQYNISSSAVKGLSMENEWVSFNARFSGISQDVMVPVRAVLGMMARENGQGMIFNDEIPDDDSPDSGPDNDGSGPPDSPPKRPTLKVVK